MGSPVIHFEVVGADGAKLQEFYGGLFDWKINTDNAMNYGIVDNGGEGINGGIGETDQGKGHVTFYVQTDDISKSLEKAERLGGSTVMPRTELNDMVTIGLFADPEGHVVGLVEGM